MFFKGICMRIRSQLNSLLPMTEVARVLELGDPGDPFQPKPYNDSKKHGVEESLPLVQEIHNLEPQVKG